MCAGVASKLGGRLAWCNSACFRKLGRNFLPPIFARQRSSCVGITSGSDLESALRWWRIVLAAGSCVLREWAPHARPLCRLFVDARSKPPRVAAVLVADKRIEYCDLEPPAEVLALFKKRDDGDIMSLELLSIALGLSSFAERLAGRNVEIFSDNTGLLLLSLVAGLHVVVFPCVCCSGAESATRKGSSKEWDHSCIVHCIWSKALQLGTGLWISRVPSKDNISDDPSREKYDLLKKCKAIRVRPCLDPVFSSSQSWDSLSISSKLLVEEAAASAA